MIVLEGMDGCTHASVNDDFEQRECRADSVGVECEGG